MRKAGAKNYKIYSKQILKNCKNKPVSFEVFADKELNNENIKLNITAVYSSKQTEKI